MTRSQALCLGMPTLQALLNVPLLFALHQAELGHSHFQTGVWKREKD